MDHDPQPASPRDLISDVTDVQPRRRLPSTPRQVAAADLAAAAAAVANYRFTVGPDEAFPLPPSPLVKPKNSSSGRCLLTYDEWGRRTLWLVINDTVQSAAYVQGVQEKPHKVLPFAVK